MKSVILINVGTPESPSPEDVGFYLREFLMDENILPLPRPFRDILVKAIIVPRRKYISARKYQSIWTDKGSPLMVESLKLQASLQTFLGDGWNVVLGMQVGKPRLRQSLKDVSEKSAEIHVVPLYPQYATATTGGALGVLNQVLQASSKVKVLDPFYQQTWFLRAQAQRIRDRLQPQDHLLLSYHGLPVSQLRAHRSQCYQSESCCLEASACAQNCYKAQCLRTSRLLQQDLGLPQVSIGFQSRLGRSRWIEPSTQQVVRGLAGRGVKHLKVACPSFVADCLETLEEIGMELKHEFEQAGGQSFELVESLNSHEVFVRGLGQALLSQK